MNAAAKKFVVQEHTRSSETHWDLMLESGGILRTWRINTPPQHISNKPTSAEKIFDHDIKFLTYQGPVNNGLGSICIVDEGTFETLDETQETIRLHLRGKILFGTFALENIEHDHWRFFRS
ncbi:MAG: DNA polymerase ligase N-terminal domain-containing protein [Sedimentisphaerales bacterium]|nr:DNA polymerase ligase N-terminal domain-containing protein [Sedimentisphaerales bacterium]